MKSSVSYTGIVLSEHSRNRLLDIFGAVLEKHGFVTESPQGKRLCHHMTCNLGQCPDEFREFLGESVSLVLDAWGMDSKCFAARVQEIRHPEIASKNEVPHITIGCNYANGGKPVMSNDLKCWIPIVSASGHDLVVDGIFGEVPH